MPRFSTVVIVVIAILLGFLMIRHSMDSIERPDSDKDVKAAVSVAEQPLVPSFEDWREFSPPSGAFKVMFPSIPQNTSDSILDRRLGVFLEYNTFIAPEENGPIIVVTTIAYPKNIEEKQVEETLRGLVDDMLIRNKKNKLEYANLEMSSPHPSLDFSLISDQLLMIGKVILDKNMAYILTMANERAVFNSDELKFFLNSFTLNDK